MTCDMDFFHQATMTICGSLDVNKMIGNCTKCLGRYIPLDGIILCTYERERGAIRILAHNNAMGMNAWPGTIHLTPSTQKFMETANLQDRVFQGANILRNTDPNPVTREACELLNLSALAKLVLYLNLAGHPVIAPGTMEKLMDSPWPGNVRELENMVERALIRHKSLGEDTPLVFTNIMEHPGAPSLKPPSMNEPDSRLTLDQAITRHIKSVLRTTAGKIQGQDGAAAILRVHPNTLRSRMDKLGIAYGKQNRTS